MRSPQRTISNYHLGRTIKQTRKALAKAISLPIALRVKIGVAVSPLQTTAAIQGRLAMPAKVYCPFAKMKSHSQLPKQRAPS